MHCLLGVLRLHRMLSSNTPSAVAVSGSGLFGSRPRRLAIISQNLALLRNDLQSWGLLCLPRNRQATVAASGSLGLPASELKFHSILDFNQKSKSKSKLCYDRRSVGRSVLASSIHLGLVTKLLLLSDSCGVADVGRSLWREIGSAV
jgi:hypothetical protein